MRLAPSGPAVGKLAVVTQIELDEQKKQQMGAENSSSEPVTLNGSPGGK